MAAHIPGGDEKILSEKRGIVDELHKAARRNYPRRYVTIKGLYDLLQADLVEMQPYAKENRGYIYLLTVIDAFSKRGWAVPLKSKSGKEVAEALKKLFGDLKRSPKFLQTDQGKEFYNSNVAQVLKEFNVKHYSSFSILKASIVERFNRTIKTWMWKEFSLRGSYEWLSLLDKLLKRYNTRIHRTTGFAPIEVNERNEEIVLRRLQNKNLPPKKKPKFKVGDPVRISKFKHVFEKGYTPNWTTEIFFVEKIEKTVPVTYKIKDGSGQQIEGGFYEPELLKTKYTDVYLVEKIIRRRGKHIYVKWLGFDSKHNQWIEAKDLRN